MIKELGLHTTASVTMDRFVGYELPPAFLTSLVVDSVSFSYLLSELGSSILGYSDSDLEIYTQDESLEAFAPVKRFTTKFLVVKSARWLEKMQRCARNEEQQRPCMGGHQYFYLDWNLDLSRCHNCGKSMCSIYEFEGA